MKLTIEINDETLKNAIGQQLERVVATEVREQIAMVVDKVLNTKLERFNDDVMSKRIENAAIKMLTNSLGNQVWGRENVLRGIIERAATNIVREKMK